MKISVCGKGGSGKSTIVALLAERLAAAGKEVLIIDSDESNYGLHRHLGMENPKEFTGFFGGKEEVLNNMMLSNFTHQFFEGQWRISDIPEDYYTEKHGIKLMVCDPSYESVQLAAKIRELGEKLQKPVYYVLNKTDETSREVLTQAIQNSQRILAVLPAEPELTAAALLGRKLVWESSVMDRAAEKICGMQA